MIKMALKSMGGKQYSINGLGILGKHMDKFQRDYIVKN